MPLILGTNSIKDTGYDVANSLRFESAYLQNPSSGASSSAERKTLTWSFWFKRSKLGAVSSTQYVITGRYSSTYYVAILLNSTDQLRVIQSAGGSTQMDLKTNRKFRDTASWYHVVVAIDTTQSTSSNRVKIYVNGTQETSFATETYPSQDLATYFGMTSGGDGYPTYIGSNTSAHFSGYMAEVVEVGGSQLTPTSFGEFDSDTPTVWKPKDLSDLSFGSTAGANVYLDFEDSSDLGNDISGGNNDYSLNSIAATDQSTDTCTNNFATFNPLITFPANPPVLSEGNLKVETVDQDPAHFGGASTIGVSQGKWYFESTSLSSRELVTAGGGSITHAVGIHSDPAEAARLATTYSAQVTGGVWYATNGKYYSTATGTSGASYGSTFAHDDIIGVAIDLDNHKAYFHKNGTYQNSGDPTSGSTGTGAISIPTGLTYFAFVTDVGGSANTSSINFGSPINSISSGNADANGFGNFEYAVPSGYFSLCTKNLAEFG